MHSINSFDFNVVTYNGTDHLTWTSMGRFGHWWSDMEGSSKVAAFVADSSYNIQKKVMSEDDRKPNMHEFSIVDGGKSAILTVEKVQQQDVSSLTSKHPDGFDTLSTGFREIDLGTGRTKFDWLPLDHGVTVDESFFLRGVDDDGVAWDFL
jgi:hypothetical protein